MIVVMALGGILFAAGGTDIPGIGGQKWLRRYVLPVFFAFICLLSHVIWWKALGMAVSLIVILSCPYGSKTPYWLKALVFSGYGAAFLWIGFTFWVIATPVICFALFCLSNWKLTAKSFWWKMVEFSYGFLLAITLISCIN
jgi:hypothetical protein